MENEDQTDPSAAADEDAIWKEVSASVSQTHGLEAAPATAGVDEDDGSPGDVAGGADEQPATAGATDAPADQPTDPWANAPEALRAAHQAALAQYENRLRSEAGRQAALQRELRNLRAAMAAPQVQNSEPAEGEDDPDIKTFREDYAEVATPVEKMVQRELDRRLRPLTEAQQAAAEAAEAERLAEEGRFLLERHPDYLDVIKADSDRFNAWRAEQPRHIQEAIERNWAGVQDGREVADVMDRYKQAIGVSSGPSVNPAPPAPVNPLAARRQLQREAAAMPRTSRQPSVASGIPNDDSDATWAAITADVERRLGQR